MPLHDWSNDDLWEDLHGYWIVRLADSIRPQLPEGYRLRLGSIPRLDIGGGSHPDISVQDPNPVKPTNGHGNPALHIAPMPDSEVAVETIEDKRTIFVQRRQSLVAVVELVSPRNKDRPAARDAFSARYAGYLLSRVNLLLVDLLPRPKGFSFADSIAERLPIPEQPSVPTPLAISYRVGEVAAEGGHKVAVWRRPLTVGQALPDMPLFLNVDESVMVDLETTYRSAAESAYLT